MDPYPDPRDMTNDALFVVHVLPRLYRPSGVLKQSRVSLALASSRSLANPLVDVASSSSRSASAGDASGTSRTRVWTRAGGDAAAVVDMDGYDDDALRSEEERLLRAMKNPSAVRDAASAIDRPGVGSTTRRDAGMPATRSGRGTRSSGRRGTKGVGSVEKAEVVDDDVVDDDGDDETPSTSEEVNEEEESDDEDTVVDASEDARDDGREGGRGKRRPAADDEPSGANQSGSRATRKKTRPANEDEMVHAYDALDAKNRGFFTARDLRRVADANGFPDWRDDDVRAMLALFKPENVRNAMDANDPSLYRMTREEFEDVVRRSGARVTR